MLLLNDLLANLSVQVDAFATCRVAHGWRLRLPALDWATFHFVLQGTGSVRDAEGASVAVHRDSLVIVPPHLAHGIECGSSRRLAEASPATHVGPGLPDHAAGPAGPNGLTVACGRARVAYGPSLGLFDHLQDLLLMDFADSRDVRAVFRQLRAEQRSPGPGSGPLMSALMNQALVHIFRRLCDQPECRLPWLAALGDPDLARVIDRIIEAPDADHTVASLADIAYMSRATFARRFRAAFGCTPMEYVRDVRLRHGARLLREAPWLPIKTVARRSGFSSRSGFSRAFSGFFGRSPATFRDQTPP